MNILKIIYHMKFTVLFTGFGIGLFLIRSLFYNNFYGAYISGFAIGGFITAIIADAIRANE